MQLMLRYCANQSDMTLISQRRMGKTGLTLRLFDELHTVRPDIHTIYLDIFASRCIDDFIKLLAEATMKSFRPKTSIGERLMAFIFSGSKKHLMADIFANGHEAVDIEKVKSACEQLMGQGEDVYLQYRQMLTDKQWNYLIAVAKEDSVRHITASEFLKRHKIGTPSVSRRLADALCEKGLLNDNSSLDGTAYSVSDIFMSHWMERL